MQQRGTCKCKSTNNIIFFKIKNLDRNRNKKVFLKLNQILRDALTLIRPIFLQKTASLGQFVIFMLIQDWIKIRGNRKYNFKEKDRIKTIMTLYPPLLIKLIIDIRLTLVAVLKSIIFSIMKINTRKPMIII